MNRRKVSKSKSKRLFKRTGSTRTAHARNYASANQYDALRYRGGIRL